MNALQTENGQLKPAKIPTPQPNAGELLVEVKAAGVNRADILQKEGKYPPPAAASPLLGLEVSGTVAAVGEGVKNWKVGDRVFGLMGGGGYAQYAILNSRLAMPVPDALDFTEAAAIPEVFLTAWQALKWLAKLQPGEKILIHAGASGVGTAAIQLAKFLGAEAWVTASAGKHAACRALGASLTIDYKQQNFAEVIHERTAGKGVAVILDFIGASYWQQNLQSLSLDGRLVMLAFLGGVKTEANLAPLLQKRIAVFGSTLRSRSLDYQAALTEDLAAFLIPRLQKGEIKPVIHKVYSWLQANEAHQEMAQNRNVGKIILRF